MAQPPVDMQEMMRMISNMSTGFGALQQEVNQLKAASSQKPERTDANKPSFNQGGRGSNTQRSRGRGRGGRFGGGRGRGGGQGQGGYQSSSEDEGAEDQDKKKKYKVPYGEGPVFPSRDGAKVDSVNNAWATVDHISQKIWADVMADATIPRDKRLYEYRKRVQYMRVHKPIFRSPATILKGFVKVSVNDEEFLVDKNRPNDPRRYAYWTFRTVYNANPALVLKDDLTFVGVTFDDEYNYDDVESQILSKNFRVFNRDKALPHYRDEFERAALAGETVRPRYFGFAHVRNEQERAEAAAKAGYPLSRASSMDSIA